MPQDQYIIPTQVKQDLMLIQSHLDNIPIIIVILHKMPQGSCTIFNRVKLRPNVLAQLIRYTLIFLELANINLMISPLL